MVSASDDRTLKGKLIRLFLLFKMVKCIFIMKNIVWQLETNTGQRLLTLRYCFLKMCSLLYVKYI